VRNDKVVILRESVVKITQMLSGKGIKVTQQGVNAYVKADHNGTPVLVNLPYLPDNAGEDLCLAIQGFLDHEVAHILFTEFNLMGQANKLGRQIGFMLNALEDPRIEKEMGKRFQGSAYNLSNTGKFYLDKFVVPRLQEAASKGDANAVVQTLMVPMIRAMSGQRVFQEFMNDKWGSVAVVHKRIEDLQPRIEAAASTADCLELAKEIGKRLSEGSSPKKSDKDDESEDSGDSGESSGKGKGKKGKGKAEKPSKKSKPEKADHEDPEDPDWTPEGEDESEKPEEGESDGEGKSDEEGESDGEGKSEKEPKKKPEDEKSGGDEKSEEEGETDSSEVSDGKSGDEEDEEGDLKEAEEKDEESGVIGAGASMSSGGETEVDGEELGESKPIWDELDKDGRNGYDESMSRVITESAMASASNADYLPFTKDYDLIEKLPIGSGYEPGMTQRLIEKVDHMVGPLQKDLERAIAARSLATRSHGHRSGRLHAANLSRLAFNDNRVFSRKHESNSKDVAVELVVDASGSMGGSKIHTACQSAYALSAVLERLGIKHEVICFTTKDVGTTHAEMYKQQMEHGIRFSRAEGLYMPILKGYDERHTTNVKERFGWLPNTNILRSNVDGECVEIAARRLIARREEGKIMIVLSDGYPAAAGSRGDLEKHLIRVVKDVDRAGVRVVGIGIESDAVKRFYPKNIVLNSVGELPAAVIKELRHLLMQ
jgi:cobaltochelatase CobT